MIEAHSFGQLLHLADDPPLQYPRQQTTGHGSLTLYLARVPGSKDIFLTSVKPLEKVVRAGDVESCLYYVHFNTERDAELLHEAEESLLADRPNAFKPLTGVAGQQSTVHRKPVLPPRTAPRDASQAGRNAAPKPPLQMPIQRKLSVARKPVGQAKIQTDSSQPSKRLIGPRPLNGQAVGLQVQDMNIPQDYMHKTSHAANLAEISGISSYNYDKSRQLELDNLYESNTNIDNHFAGTRLSTESSFPSSSVTLIRRYDGQQFNVGQVEAGGSIKLFGDGYRKFEQSATTPSSGGEVCNFQTHLAGVGSASPQFLTPWRTTCQFAASVGGHTLQCTHLASGAAQSSTLSELRFNLPTSQALCSAPKRPSSYIGESGKRSSFMRLHQRHRSERTMSSEDDTNVTVSDKEQVDLTLGQELAGGGFGGKNAKMAKIIVHPEGYPMLDLLIAGNISIFLRIYEKYGPEKMAITPIP